MMTERFADAVKLAVHLHRDQMRKGSNVPYVSHLLRVAGMVLELGATSATTGADEDTAIAAMLHDAVEDQGGLQTAKLICEQFGERVERFVLECSDSVTGTDQPKRPWRERKEVMIASIKDLTPETRLIIACDKLDNLRCTVNDYPKSGPEFWKRFSGGREGTLWYYRSMIDALRNTGCCPIWEELEITLARLKRLIKERENQP